MAEIEYLTVEHLSLKDITRIFSKITVNPLTECWEWQAYKNPDGYGRVRFRGRLESIHRLLYAWIIAPLPRGQRHDKPQLDHLVCDNPSCANPAHIQMVPHRTNVLRGTGPTAINARKTHCIRGHPLTVASNKRGGRECKVCYREHDRRRNQSESRRAAKRIKSRERMRKVIKTEAYRQYRREYLARKRLAHRCNGILEKDA